MGYKRVSLTTESSKGEKEYKPVKNFFFESKEEKKEFNREEWRNSKIEYVLSENPLNHYKNYSHLMIADVKSMDLGSIKWDDNKIKNLDDVALTFICNVIDNFKSLSL